jgi:shikimate kinase
MKHHEIDETSRLRAALAGRPLALAGFMGAGKSSVGRILAERLGRRFFDTDELVSEELGAGPETLFPEGREADFRRVEAAAVARAVRSGDPVVALGGGALLDPRTRALLAAEALVVHLDVPWAELQPVLSALRPSRPLLAGRSDAEVHRLYVERLAVYRTAHLSVRVSRGDPAMAAEAVLQALLASEGGERGQPAGPVS